MIYAKNLKVGDRWTGNPNCRVQRIEKSKTSVCVWWGIHGKVTDPMQVYNPMDKVHATEDPKK